ncbi:prephenate dehydrogenase/arogenate dehydrogenase family protein [Fibrobacter sp.]|uniref:prephenate dehydrogenase/arogenate dehydrogenase family protein n=1 Tax=Fibrobacter sp. TaxID=35828 RepID=UPI0025EEE633|nr:prephenate dehydrogenase/arogenate dehydrogenase family protein [Fibrobacter sp.]MDD7498954.1 prephenate dehydrogenase/arogenate dehydrogenase family protein [Fibrobacter sp.]MDY5723859.1 prephenate dehydrogenase/arogenate dehydrogenase family protein [Fibrobacter sp.]
MRITFVGFGLLASSVAAAIKQAKLPTVVRAVSSPATLARAKELGLADECFGYDEITDWVPGSDMILLCAPILHILHTIENLAQMDLSVLSSQPKILVSDIGSTKVEICKAGAKLPKPFVFVGSHPMAGSEKRTLEYNDPSIFENAYWFVCPPEGVEEADYKSLLDLISFVGANAVVFPPEHHDRTMAWVSHMPQMLASTLAASMPERLVKPSYQHYAGRAFRDMTRIAASGWNMWHDIAVTNRDQTVLALREVREGLDKTIKAMDHLQVVSDGKPAADDRAGELESVFKAGNEGRASLFEKGRNAAAAFSEITVPLKDVPGALLQVLSPLAQNNLNIRDIELMKVRENIAGTLLLAFKTPEEARRAVQILKLLGYDVKER